MFIFSILIEARILSSPVWSLEKKKNQEINIRKKKLVKKKKENL